MSKLLAVLERIAVALEASNARYENSFKSDYDAKMRKRGRFLLEIEKDKRFPDLRSKIRNPENQRLPINDFMIEWLSDEAKDGAAVLDYLISNPETCARIGFAEEPDAKRHLQAIDDKLFSKSASSAADVLRPIFGNKDTPNE